MTLRETVHKNRAIYNLAMALLVVWLVYVFYKTLTWWPVPMGESDDYMLATISLQYGHNLGIDDQDFHYALQDFPTFGEYLTSSYENQEQSPVVDEKTGRLPWYFGTYSALCLPAKILLAKIHLPQILCYPVTNYFLYLLVVVAGVLLCKKPWNVFLGLLLAVNPVTFYLVWQSAEVFIFSMVALSAIFLMKNNPHLAALCLSIGGTMNSTVMVFGVFIILDYLFSEWKRTGRIWNLISLKTIGLACCFVPCLIPFVYYKAKYGLWNLQADAGMARAMEWYPGRIMGYLFDLNYGMLPYFAVLMLLSVLCLVLAIKTKYARSFVYLLSFFGVVAAYSIMFHINCGMAGIARYNVWSIPILIVGCVDAIANGIFKTQGDTREVMQNGVIQNRGLVRLFGGVMMASIVYTGCVTNAYGVVFASNTSDIELTPIAKYVLDEHPSLYHELEWSFITRVQHAQGIYSYSEPVYYEREDGDVTKILLSPADVDGVKNSLVMDEATLSKFDRQTRNKSDLFYVTFQKGDAVKRVAP